MVAPKGPGAGFFPILFLIIHPGIGVEDNLAGIRKGKLAVFGKASGRDNLLTREALEAYPWECTLGIREVRPGDMDRSGPILWDHLGLLPGRRAGHGIHDRREDLGPLGRGLIRPRTHVGPGASRDG